MKKNYRLGIRARKSYHKLEITSVLIQFFVKKTHILIKN